MSVRLRKWNDVDGKVNERWMIDVKVKLPGSSKVTRVRDFSPVNTRRGAEQHERQIRQQILDGTFGKVVAEIPTLEGFRERFLKHARTNNKPSTAKTKEDILRKHLVPEFGAITLNAITVAKIEAFKAAKRAEGLSAKTVNNVLTVLHKLLATAEEFGELDEVPDVVWLKAPKPEIDFLSFEEADRLSARAEPGRWQTMIVLDLNTGLRIGELAGLKRSDVDLDAGRVVVRRNVWRGNLGTPKGGREREVPLNQRAREVLKEHFKHTKSEWVFPQRDGGFIRNPQHTCSEAILRNAENAGLRPFGWHTLRHTFASHLVMRGVPLKAVQELLGHATIDMTMRYAHLSPSVVRSAVDLLVAPAPNAGGAQAGHML